MRPKIRKRNNLTRFVQSLDIVVHSYTFVISERDAPSFSPTGTSSLTTRYQMALSSNVFIDRGTFNSAQGDMIHIHNGNSEYGMHDFTSVQKNNAYR